MLKGGCNCEIVVGAKQKVPQAIFHGKTIFCAKIVLANCALLVREVITNLSIESPRINVTLRAGLKWM
jgi:hypothetical protein